MLMTYWYPTYLQEARGASPDLSSWLSGMVLGAGALGCFFGGWLTDFLLKATGSRRWSRTAQSIAGAGLAASGLFASLFVGDTIQSAVLVAVACFGLQVQLPAWWATGTQISGKNLGALMGLMNMIGNLGGAALQTVFGYYVGAMKRTGYLGRARWDPGILIYVAIALLGLACWSMINPEQTVEEKASDPVGSDIASPS
jgi:MFS family permease